MTVRTLWFCLLLFTAGAAGGWLWAAGNSAVSSPQILTPSGPFPPSSTIPSAPGLPEASGLPGDTIHLSTITDIRTLRTLWDGGDDATRGALFGRWMERDPAEGIRFYLFELVNQVPRSPKLAETIARFWARRNPLEYLTFLDSVSGQLPDNLYSSFDMAIQNGLLTDSAGILKLWKTAGPPLRDWMQQYIFPHLFATDPARALAEAGQAPRKWQEKIWEAAAEAPDPAAMLETLLKNEGAARFPFAIERLIGKLADTNLPAALETTARLPSGKARQWAAQEVVEKLAETDPEAAWAWMEVHAPTDANRRAAGGSLMDKNPLKAIALDPDGTWWEDGLWELKRYARELSGKDWQAAATLAHTVGPTLRRNIVEGMASSLAFGNDDPLPQLDQLGRLFTGSGLGSNIPTHFLFRELNPTYAPVIAHWLDSQPEVVKDLLIPPMVARLSEGGPATATAWLAQLPPGKTRLEELLRTTTSWAGTDPQAAANFVLTLPPGMDRDYAVLNTAIAWHRNAPAAARAWLEALPDSPSKTRALTELQPPGRNP